MILALEKNLQKTVYGHPYYLSSENSYDIYLRLNLIRLNVSWFDIISHNYVHNIYCPQTSEESIFLSDDIF